jgi:F-type H+-transporting ATPase subunit alpha
MDRVPVQDIRRFEGEFLQYLRHAPGSPLDAIKESKVLSDDTEKTLLTALAEFSDTFTTSEGNILGRQPEVKPMDSGEVGQEKVQVQVRRPPAKK